MKNSTHQILYVSLFSAVGFLLFMQFFTNDSKMEKSENKEIIQSNLIVNRDSGNVVNIAYVNSDTVSKYYEYAKKIQKDLTNKRSEAENQIKSKYFAYESLVKEFEKASPIMGDREKMEKAQKIRLLEQEIMQVEQQLSAQVSKEELRLTEGYIMKTNEFMQDIGQRLGYDYVMSYRVGGAMLYANPSHDITNEIIELLNQEYKNIK
jgi:outer membrane protein|tara:strand:+ start:8275 stop:8895 length:621 start_codon:yes stop_codon:yes gene_type:complete